MSITALHIPVGEPPRLVEISASEAEPLQNLVGGNFQLVDVAAGISLWLNEDGKTLGLGWNELAQKLWDASHGAGTDYIVGPVVLTSGSDAVGNALPISAEQLTHIERELGLVRVGFENTYSDGHSSTIELWLPGPEAVEDEESIESWWQDTVFDHTGDGHGAANPGLGSVLESWVISGPPQLVNTSYEWVD